jgi:hypothetical protein
LQAVGRQRQQADFPYTVQCIGLGIAIAGQDAIALRVFQISGRFRAAVLERGRCRDLMTRAIAAEIGPVDPHHRHAAAARPEAAGRTHPEQAVATGEGLQRHARLEAACFGDHGGGLSGMGGSGSKTSAIVVCFAHCISATRPPDAPRHGDGAAIFTQCLHVESGTLRCVAPIPPSLKPIRKCRQ